MDLANSRDGVPIPRLTVAVEADPIDAGSETPDPVHLLAVEDGGTTEDACADAAPPPPPPEEECDGGTT
jgi:hypothetical protein